MKVDLAFPEEESLTEQTRREWLFRALLQEPNDVWAAAKVPALRNLHEFSLILRDHRAGNAFDPRLLLPLLMLPKMRTFYTSLLNTGHHFLLSERERSEYSGKSAVTAMIFDFVRADGFTRDSLLRLPSALEKLTLSSTLRYPPNGPSIRPIAETYINYYLLIKYYGTLSRTSAALHEG